jgi:hypothetical protein
VRFPKRSGEPMRGVRRRLSVSVGPKFDQEPTHVSRFPHRLQRVTRPTRTPPPHGGPAPCASQLKLPAAKKHLSHGDNCRGPDPASTTDRQRRLSLVLLDWSKTVRPCKRDLDLGPEPRLTHHWHPACARHDDAALSQLSCAPQ